MIIAATVIMALVLVAAVKSPKFGLFGKNKTENIQEKKQNQEIAIKKEFFQPDAVLLKKGTTVVWTNEDAIPHQVQFSAFSSKEILPGKKFSYTFDNTGIYDYFCPLHPEKKARIVVE